VPILERDPWRMQYFEGVACPESLVIPTDDPDAWLLYPKHRWIYNKMMIAETQGLDYGPFGVPPPRFPMFAKPIVNLKGMAVGSRVIERLEEWEREPRPGHMWMPLCTGEHVSTDVAVVDGAPCWWRHVVGKPLPDGLFDYWTVLAEARPALERSLGDWLRAHLGSYTGMVNLETIGGTIIEGHLRFSDQWPDLYGPGWVEALVALYAHGRWRYADDARRDGYSVVLFGAHGPRYRQADPATVDELRARPGIASVQITFHADKPPVAHAMPPGGFRLAIVNCWDLDAGLEARERLAVLFWTAQRLGPRAARGRTPRPRR
jgi:hypothetical protein